jgi:hypothetical protein
MSIRFRFNWMDAGPSPDRMARHTMASLSIEAGDATITAVLDRRNRSYRDHVIVPLYHVAEWLVTNWWHIWYEVADTREQRPDFEFRHSLAFAGDGFVLPNLSIVPESDRMHLRWTRYKPRYTRIEFVDESETIVERRQLEEQLRTIVEAVLERMRGGGGNDTGLRALEDAWDAVNGLDPEEQEFSRAAALLGLDPYEVPEAVAATIIGCWDKVDPSIREDALASASKESLIAVSEWLNQTFEVLANSESGSDWTQLRATLSACAIGAPWTRGYELARCARSELGVGEEKFEFDMGGALALRHSEQRPPSTRIHGVVAVDAPTCVTAPRAESGKRFLLARALGDYLDRTEPGAGILSSLATDRQAQSRAFAAEFLAPASSLRAAIGDANLVEPEQVDDLGRRFGVAGEVIRRQIENHNIAGVAQV